MYAVIKTGGKQEKVEAGQILNVEKLGKAVGDEVTRVFREALARDKTRTQVFEISELGLCEMTRKRIGEGLLESFAGRCPHCEGRGLIIDPDLIPPD